MIEALVYDEFFVHGCYSLKNLLSGAEAGELILGPVQYRRRVRYLRLKLAGLIHTAHRFRKPSSADQVVDQRILGVSQTDVFVPTQNHRISPLVHCEPG